MFFLLRVCSSSALDIIPQSGRPGPGPRGFQRGHRLDFDFLLLHLLLQSSQGLKKFPLTLLRVMWQPGWEGNLAEKGSVYGRAE